MKIAVQLLGYCVLCFLQNAAWTWCSRSLNSGDHKYHRWAALWSNAVYWSCGLPLTLLIIRWQNKPLLLVASGVVFTLATTEGSTQAMRFLLKHEQGKQKVGSH